MTPMEPGPHTATRMATVPPNIRTYTAGIRTNRREGIVAASTPTSPPTRRAMNVLDALAVSSTERTSAQLARQCAVSTSTSGWVLPDLDRGGWFPPHDDRRYGLGSGLFGLV